MFKIQSISMDILHIPNWRYMAALDSVLREGLLVDRTWLGKHGIVLVNASEEDKTSA